jgi:hypothetical protein
LKFHPKHATNKNKTKHIMKISHISFIWLLKIPSLEYYTTYPKTTNFICNYENKRGRKPGKGVDADVVENTPNQHFVLLLRKMTSLPVANFRWKWPIKGILRNFRLGMRTPFNPFGHR